MSTRAYIGIRHPELPGMVQLRYVHTDGNPPWMIQAIRHIWATTAARDTRHLITLLLEYDWYLLDADTTATGMPIPDARPVPGVGMSLAFIDISTGQVPPPDPFALVIALPETGDLDAQWIYLLDPAADTVAVHAIGGALVGTELLEPA